MSGIDLSDLVPEFLAEVKEHLATLEKGLLSLESAPEGEARKQSVHALFRAAHTIKGSSRMMGFAAVHEVAHAIEEVLGAIREDRLAPSGELVDVLLRSVDRLRSLAETKPDATPDVSPLKTEIRALLAPKPEPAAPAVETVPAIATASPKKRAARKPAPPAAQPEATAAPPPSAPIAEPTPDARPAAEKAGDEMVRVAVSRLDELLRLTGELMMDVARIEDLDRWSLTLMTHLQSHLRRSLETVRGDTRTLHLLEGIDSWRTAFAGGSGILNSVSGRIEQEVMSLRMFPIATVFAPLPRLVRDLAKEHGKEVTLQVSGEATELDRRILQTLSEPLLHIVRNAVDHGLETPDVRRRAGKPPVGTLRIRAYRQASQVRVEIADDGRGLSPKALRETAVRKKLLSHAEAEALDDPSALDLIYLPGFSTSLLITSTSGRGVGMDVVRTTIQQLGGLIELESEPGRGTRFTLGLPLTVTLSRVLMVEIAERTYAVPSAVIERIVRLRPENLSTTGGREQLVVAGEPISLLRLGRLLAPDSNAPPDELAFVFVSAGRRAAFAIGKVLEEREIVLKPLGDVLARGDMASGATLLPDGTVALILDPTSCLRVSRGVKRAAAKVEQKAVRTVLVVDDSTTTRELERSILVASGYQVETAVDGADGWRKLEQGAFDVVVTDVEMPIMNGFELTKRIKADARTAHLPVIIITTLDRDQEKRKGLEAGAQAYLVKNAFDQSELIETIDRLLP